MKSKKAVVLKRCLFGVSVLLILAGLYFIHSYNQYKKGKESVFNKMPGFIPYEIKQAEKRMYKDNQYIKVDDYTITLDELNYSSDKNYKQYKGWCKFAVKREAYPEEVTINLFDPNEMGWNDLSQHQVPFGKRKNFAFEVPGDAASSSHGKSTANWFSMGKNVMYVYYYVWIDGTNTYNNCVYLYDTTMGEEGYRNVFESHFKEDMLGVFELRENSDTDKYTYTYSKKGIDYEVVISPYTCNMRGDGNPEIKDMSIHFNNGEVLNVRKDNTLGEGIEDFGEYVPDDEGYLKTYSCVLGFTESIDIETIDYVEINGEKLKE